MEPETEAPAEEQVSEEVSQDENSESFKYRNKIPPTRSKLQVKNLMLPLMS